MNNIIIERQELPTNGVSKVELVETSEWLRADKIALSVGLIGILFTVVLTAVLIIYAIKLDSHMKKLNDITEALSELQRKQLKEVKKAQKVAGNENEIELE